MVTPLPSFFSSDIIELTFNTDTVMIITFKNSKTGNHTRISCDRCDTPMIYTEKSDGMIMCFTCIHNGKDKAKLKTIITGPEYPINGVDKTESFNNDYCVVKGRRKDIYNIRWMDVGDVMYITDGRMCVED